MRASVVGLAAAGAALVAFILPAGTASGGVHRDPKCGPHGWALNVLDSSHVYGGMEVDKPAVAYRNNPTIPWPGTRDQNDNGASEMDSRDARDASVVARFVVDTMGCIDSTSFKVVSASDSAFSKSVQSVITRLHYKPAQRGDQKVRSWVLWKFLMYRTNGAELPGTH